MIAPGVAAGESQVAMVQPPPANALEVHHGAVHPAEAQGLVVAQGELLTVDRSSSAVIQWLQELACWASEPKRRLQQGAAVLVLASTCSSRLYVMLLCHGTVAGDI